MEVEEGEPKPEKDFKDGLGFFEEGFFEAWSEKEFGVGGGRLNGDVRRTKDRMMKSWRKSFILLSLTKTPPNPSVKLAHEHGKEGAKRHLICLRKAFNNMLNDKEEDRKEIPTQKPRIAPTCPYKSMTTIPSRKSSSLLLLLLLPLLFHLASVHASKGTGSSVSLETFYSPYIDIIPLIEIEDEYVYVPLEFDGNDIR
ncbi:hypothetical protein TL16_g02657 [Triparma laevis f. inornata]|uniref:Uncharacterized protein n=1 Tax=Triparma laevis f. inornata TaxID=1714386 RepID=A0A9W6ZZH0_9STRA|nr:hypothetical protein TL16_g02657 [Triparma laevis f. inornata]